MVALKDQAKLQRFFLLLAICMLIVGILYFAKPVFAPLAIAVLLTFILTPLVSWVQRWGLSRVPAVLLVVILVFALLGSIISVFVAQLKGLATELPTYKTQIAAKINGLHDVSTPSWIANIQDVLNSVTKVASEEGQSKAEALAPVRVQVESSAFPMVQSIASPVLEFLVNAILVFILVVFMSVRREDLRNRLIRLLGHHNLNSTTRVLDDASQRISRFLFYQFVLNIGFGVVLALGLMVIGIPYAYIWGFMAALLRYVPYIGPWIAALFPLIASLVMPGWTPFFLVFGYFIVLELIHGNVVEPLVFGHSIGVSGVALLVAALFWAWLWGPLGLVLSTPLTACLFVFGRHVPSLEFLSLLLGDEPVMQKSAIYYQRLLAKDPEEAEELVEEYLKDHSVDQVYQDILFPALLNAKKDREENDLRLEDQAFILESTRDIFQDVVLPAHRKTQSPSAADKPAAAPIVILGVSTQDDTDALALDMFKDALNPDLFQYISGSPASVQGEKIGEKNDNPPSVLLLLTLSNTNMLRTRMLCKKLRALYPRAKVFVGCWGSDQDMNLVRQRLKAIGVDGVGVTFSETRNLLDSVNEPVIPAVSYNNTSAKPRIEVATGENHHV
jgi:predicted PurR-regulated permease PerM